MDIEFSSGDATCRGVYLSPAEDHSPAGAGAPAIVMAHGFGGTVDAGLLPFAKRYTAAGFHVVLFDYRHFGASDGEPRQLLAIRRQLADWRAAVAYARRVEGVDAERVALVGTSFSGGHVVVVAAGDPRIAAVIAQCPMMDGVAGLRNLVRYAGFGYLVRLVVYGAWDALRTLCGRSPFYVGIVGPPGSLAAMTTPDAEPGLSRILPPGFRNEVCARIGVTVGFYRPVTRARKLVAPLLIQICEQDSVAPIIAAEAVARTAGYLATVKRYPCGHFDVYVSPWIERSVTDHVEFLERHLTLSDADLC